MATLAPPLGIDSTTFFDVGSMSKQFGAAVIVMLAQQGKLKLTDEVINRSYSDLYVQQVEDVC
jgi:CubicO group peptidase (beta-lactamase class C family)